MLPAHPNYIATNQPPSPSPPLSFPSPFPPPPPPFFPSFPPRLGAAKAPQRVEFTCVQQKLGLECCLGNKQGEVKAKLNWFLFFAFLLKTNTGKVFSVIALFENSMEITLYKNGGSLNFVARRFL